MIKILGKIPKKICVAVSGGPDSMAALDFLSNSDRDILAMYFNHGTQFSEEAQLLVSEFCSQRNIPLVIGKISRDKYKSESQEEYWRNERYSFFSSYLYNHERYDSNLTEKHLSHFYDETKIITCHHVDDVIETWVFSSLHGNPMLIPYSRDNFIRPFLLTEKVDFLNWAERSGTPYMVDPSNNESKYMRSFIRNELIPLCKTVNPGLKKTIRKKVKDYFSDGRLTF